MGKRDKPPAPIVRKERGRFVPVTAYDAEAIEGHKANQEYDLVPRSPRSPPHNGMYWAQLGKIVKATEAFPTSEHMHRWIKHGLGYTSPIMHPKTGAVVAVVVDSTAFDKMDQAGFNDFYERACRLVIEEMGIDMQEML